MASDPKRSLQPNAKVLSTSCQKTCHCRVLVRENSHKGQNGKATCFFFFCVCVCDAVFLVSFLTCQTPPPDHMQCDRTKACQTISGLVRKTRGRLIIPQHAIGWNLRVCLLWLTGVESSIGYVHKLAGTNDLASSFLVEKSLQAIRKMQPSCDTRLPITEDILHLLVSTAGHAIHSMYRLKLMQAMFMLEYHAFPRVGEITESEHNPYSCLM